MGCCQSTKHNENLTFTGKVINKRIVKHLVSRQDLENLINRSVSTDLHELDVIFKPIYCHFTYVCDYLYLTGFGGMTDQNIKSHNIKGIISATYECALFEIPGIKFVRIAVEDSPDEHISRYFDEVCFRIEKWTRNKLNVVIHCLCGISRSATFVLAYLMKHKRMSLKVSFQYLRVRRTFIRPNSSFFEQLIAYEQKIFKKTTVKMIEFTTRKGVKIIIPDFFVQDYPEETEKESTLSDATISPLFASN